MAPEQTSSKLDSLLSQVDKDGLNRKLFAEFLAAYNYEYRTAENILYWLYRYRVIDEINLERVQSSPKALRTLEEIFKACRKRIDEDFLSTYASGGWPQSYLRSKARHKSGAKYEDFARAAAGRCVIGELAKILPDAGILERMGDLSHPHDIEEWMRIARKRFLQKVQNNLSAACRKRVVNVRNISDYFLEEFMATAYRDLADSLDDDADLISRLISEFESSDENFELGAKYESKYRDSDVNITDFDVEMIFGGDAIVLERDGLLRSRLAPLAETLAKRSPKLRIPSGDYFENVPLRYRTERGDLLDKIVPVVAILVLIVAIFYLRFLLPFWLLFIIFFYLLRPAIARRGGITEVVRRIILKIKGVFRK